MFNAPFSNTRSVAELVIGEIVMLLRRIFPRSVSAHEGGWDKSATGSREVRGRTLGIVGYGNIGSQLSTLAEAIGMRVIYFDRTDKLRHGNTEPVEKLEELLAQSDVVSLHVPETPETAGHDRREGAAGDEAGLLLINNSRGTVVDLDALAGALRDGHLAGAAIDVFPVEPSSNCGSLQEPGAGPRERHPHPAYRRLDRGGAGAHRRRGRAQAGRLFHHRLDHGRGEFPGGAAAAAPAGARFSHVHRNVPGMLRRLNEVFSSATSTSPRNIWRPTASSATSCSTPTSPARIRRAASADPRARRHGRRAAGIRALGRRHVPVALRCQGSLNCRHSGA